MTPPAGSTTKTAVTTAATISTKTTVYPFSRTTERARGREDDCCAN